MTETNLQHLKLISEGVQLPDAVYSKDMSPVTVNVYLDEAGHKVIQHDATLKRYRIASSADPSGSYGNWQTFEG